MGLITFQGHVFAPVPHSWHTPGFVCWAHGVIDAVYTCHSRNGRPGTLISFAPSNNGCVIAYRKWRKHLLECQSCREGGH